MEKHSKFHSNIIVIQNIVIILALIMGMIFISSCECYIALCQRTRESKVGFPSATRRIEPFPVKPVDWPKDLPFAPNRHFGPFKEGSQLGSIQVLLHSGFSGIAVARWYYNDFFDPNTFGSEEEIDIFRLYYRKGAMYDLSNVVLPTAATPSLDYSPGGGLGRRVNNILLSLNNVSYSSRNGGSIALNFRMATVPTPNADPEADQPNYDDFEYEFFAEDPNDPNYLYDVKELEMDIFVNPDIRLFNARSNPVGGWDVPMSVDLKADGVVAYRRGTMMQPNPGGGTIDRAIAIEVPFDNLARNALDKHLNILEEEIATSLSVRSYEAGYFYMQGHPQLFAHAFLHAYHPILINNIDVNDKVTKLFLADDFVDIVTSKYEQYIVVEWKIRKIVSDREDEFYVKLWVEHEFDPGHPITMWKRNIILEEGEDSSWFVIGMFHLDECGEIGEEGILMRYHVFGPPRRFAFLDRTRFHRQLDHYGLKCTPIQEQAANTFYVGLVPFALYYDEEAGYWGVRWNEGFNEDGTKVNGGGYLLADDERDVRSGEYEASTWMYVAARVRLVAR